MERPRQASHEHRDRQQDLEEGRERELPQAVRPRRPDGGAQVVRGVREVGRVDLGRRVAGERRRLARVVCGLHEVVGRVVSLAQDPLGGPLIREDRRADQQGEDEVLVAAPARFAPDDPERLAEGRVAAPPGEDEHGEQEDRFARQQRHRREPLTRADEGDADGGDGEDADGRRDGHEQQEGRRVSPEGQPQEDARQSHCGQQEEHGETDGNPCAVQGSPQPTDGTADDRSHSPSRLIPARHACDRRASHERARRRPGRRSTGGGQETIRTSTARGRASGPSCRRGSRTCPGCRSRRPGRCGSRPFRRAPT